MIELQNILVDEYGYSHGVAAGMIRRNEFFCRQWYSWGLDCHSIAAELVETHELGTDTSIHYAA